MTPAACCVRSGWPLSLALPSTHETASLVRQQAHLLSRVSAERQRDEFLSILSLANAKRYLVILDRLDLLCRLIPELAATKGVEQPVVHYWDVWEHLLHCVEAAEDITGGHQNSPVFIFVPWTPDTAAYFSENISDGHSRRTILKLAALFHDIAKPQTKATDETGKTRFLCHSEIGASMAESRLTPIAAGFTRREHGPGYGYAPPEAGEHEPGG